LQIYEVLPDVDKINEVDKQLIEWCQKEFTPAFNKIFKAGSKAVKQKITVLSDESKQAFEQCMEKVQEALSHLNKTIKGPFLAGNKVSFADFVVFGQLTDMLVLRRSLKEHEKVQQFFDSMMGQPGVT
jgi:glutathione S-transferase